MTLMYFGIVCRRWNTTIPIVPWQLSSFAYHQHVV